MIVDSSAVVAVLRGEYVSDEVIDVLLASSPPNRISAANLLEAYMVVDRSTLHQADQLVDRFLDRFMVTVEPVTRHHVAIARAAFRQFGKGSGHQARLNFGDCFAYALARFHDEPLLFVGNDFAATDIEPALPSSPAR